MRRPVKAKLALLTALVIGGGAPSCSCSDDKPGAPTVVILSPSSGRILDGCDDVNATLQGIQIDIRVQVTGAAAGQKLALYLGDDATAVIVKDISGACTGDAGSDAACVTFGGVTVPENSTNYKITVAIQGTSAANQVTVQVGAKEGLTFVSPSDGATLTSSGDAGAGDDEDPIAPLLQKRITVRACNIGDGQTIQLVLANVGLSYSQTYTAIAALSGSYVEATFASPVPSFPDGTDTLTASATVGQTTYSKQITVTVSGVCTVALTPANNAKLGKKDDKSGDAGLQLDVVVTSGCPGTAFLWVDPTGGVTNCVTAADAGASASAGVDAGPSGFTAVFSNTTLNEGAHTLVACVVGQQTPDASTSAVSVDITSPTITMVTPLEGVRTTSLDPTKIPAECADAGASYNISASVSGSAGEVLAVTLFKGSLPTAGTENGDAGYRTLTGGSQSYSFPCVPLSVGENRIRIVATDPTGNAASTYSSTASPTDYVLNYDPLTAYIAISSALAGKAYKKSDDLDPSGTPNLLELNVPYTAGSLSGRKVRLLVNGGVSQCDCSSDKSACPTTAAQDCEIDGGTFSGALRNVALPPGNHTLRLVVGSPGNANDAVYFSESVAVSVDVSTPTISMTSPAPGSCVSNAAPTLCFNVTAEEGRTLTVNGATGTVNDSGGACVTSVPLAGNQLNNLSASVVDLAGNDASVSIALTHDDAGPSTPLFERANGTALPASLTAADNATPGDGGFHYTIVVSTDGGEPTTSFATLRVGTFLAMGPLAIGADGKATFTNVELAHGGNPLTATVTDCAKNATSTQMSLNVDLSDGGPFPVLSIATFAGVAAVDGLAVPSGPSHAVTFSIADAGGGEGCTVFATGPSSTSNAVACSATAAITLATEGAYQLFATSTSGGRSRTYSLVAYGDGGPNYTIVSPPNGAVFNADAGDIDGLADFQQTAFVALTGVDVGQSVKLTVSPDSGAPLIYTEQVEVSDGGVLFARVTLPDQNASVLFVEAKNRLDAGASGTPISVLVDRKAPTLTFTHPTLDQILVKGDDHNSTNGTFDENVTLAVSGLEPGRQVTLMKTDGTSTDGGNLFVGTATVNDAGASTVTFANVALNVPDSGVVILSASASDVAGNAASTAIGVTINLTEPSIDWTTPLTSPAYYCSANAKNPGSAPLTHEFRWFLATASGGTVELVQCTGAATTCKDAPCLDGGVVVASAAVTSLSGSVITALDAGTFTFCGRYRTQAQNVGTTANPRQVTLDTVPPTVSSIVCPEMDGGVINKTSTSCTVTLSDTSASGKTISIKSTNPQAGTTVGSAPLSGATATVPISLQSGAHTLSAAGTDNACGTGDGNAISGGATLSFTVDTAAPTCYITRPSAGYLKCTDNESPPGGCTDAGQSMSYTVQSTVTGAENGQIVYVRDDGGVIGSGAMTGGAAPNIPVVLAQGNSALTIQVTDLSGNTCTSTPVNVTIDTVGPAFAVTGPASPTSDVDLTAPGIQSDVVFSASSIETGRTISIRSSTNGGTTYSAVGSKVFDGGSPDVLRVNLSAGPNKLVAYGCDTIGNCTTSAVYDLTVTGSGPTVSFVKPTGSTPNNCNPEIAQPLVYGGTGCGTVDGGTIAVSVKVSSSYTSCSDNCVTLYKDGGAIATGNLSGGAVTFAGIGALTLNDAEIGTFQARVVDSTADAGYSAFLNWSVDVSAPGNPVFDSPVCTSQPVTLNKYSDVSSGTAGLQYVFKFQTPGIEDGQTLTLTGSTQGVVGTGTVVSTYVTMPLLTVSEGSQTLTASVTDLVGNPASVQCQVNVDVTAPTDVQLDASVNRRAGTVALAWTYPGDNGMSGTAQSFDIKVSSRMAVGSLCPFVVEDAGVIDGGASISGFPKAPPLAGGTPTDASVTGLILESTYCFATEAADTAGNRSTSAPIQVVSVNTQLREDRVYGPLTDPGSLGMGQRMATGDFNGDGYTDIAFNQNPTVDASVFIVWGNDGGMQTLTAPLWVDPTLTKFGQSIANAGDMDGDGFDDLLIATNNTTAGVGATRTAFLYYGSDAGLVYGPNGTAIAGSPVRFDLNPQLSETAYARTLFVRPLGDVTGDGVPDVLFVESKAKDGGFSGQASLWLGPSRSPHDAGDCGGNPSLPECKRPPMPSPGVVARIGPSGMITINGTDTSATVCGTPGAPNVSEIGSFLGAGAIGDVNGDGIQDFFIRSASLSGGAADAGRGWVFLGKSSFSSMVGTTITLNQADVRIEAPYAATWGNVPNFAQSIAGLGRVSGSSGAACSPTPCDDFAIGADARIYIVYGRNTWPSELCLSDTHQPLLLLAGSESDAGSVGQSLAGVGDVTGDGRVDLLAGGNAGGAFFYYGTGDGGVPFGVVNGGKPDVTMVFPVGSLIGTWVMKVTSWDNDPFGDFMISTTASSGSFFVKY